MKPNPISWGRHRSIIWFSLPKKRIKENTIFTSSASLAEFAIFTRITTLTISSLVSYCTSTIFIFFRCNSISSAYRRANNLAEPNKTLLNWVSQQSRKNQHIWQIHGCYSNCFYKFWFIFFHFLEWSNSARTSIEIFRDTKLSGAIASI